MSGVGTKGSLSVAYVVDLVDRLYLRVWSLSVGICGHLSSILQSAPRPQYQNIRVTRRLVPMERYRCDLAASGSMNKETYLGVLSSVNILSCNNRRYERNDTRIG